MITSVDDWGGVYCHLEGGTTFEKSTFINSLKEIIGNVENPRYIIVRKKQIYVFQRAKRLSFCSRSYRKE